MKQPTVLFLHLLKTAGTTFNSILRLEYGRRIFTCPPIPCSDSRPAYQALDVESRRNFRLVRGHFYYGLHEDVPGPSEYVTFLRDPIKRVASYYYYLRQNDTLEHPIIQKTREMSLLDLVKNRITHECENDQVRRIAGVHPFDAEVTQEHFEKACENLRSFAMFGLTERFDESLMMIWKKLGWWKPPFYVKSNVKNKSGSLSDEEVQVIAEHNRYDMQFYEFAKELFEARVAEDPSIPQRIERFQKMNQWASYFLPTAMYARRTVEIAARRFHA